MKFTPDRLAFASAHLDQFATQFFLLGQRVLQ